MNIKQLAALWCGAASAAAILIAYGATRSAMWSMLTGIAILTVLAVYSLGPLPGVNKRTLFDVVLILLLLACVADVFYITQYHAQARSTGGSRVIYQ